MFWAAGSCFRDGNSSLCLVTYLFVVIVALIMFFVLTIVVFDVSVSFHFAGPLAAGSCVTLSLQFHGFLNDQLRGFYRTEYEHHGEKHALAVTQFEACDARRSFVCWNELP
jgi:hypothetical protein